MKFLRGKLNRRVWWRWLMSYVAIMIIPLIFGMSIYIYALSTIRDEVETIQAQSIEQVRMSVENLLDNLNRVCYTLASSAYNSGIYVERDGDDGYNPLSVQQVQRTMASYYIANNRIGKIYMYFPGNDYILTGDLTYKYARIRENTRRFLNMSEDDFKRITSQTDNGVLLTVTSEREKTLYYVYGGKEFGRRMVIFIPLNMPSLEQMVTVENTGVFLLADGVPLGLGGNERLPMQFNDGHTYWMQVPLENNGYSLVTCIDGDVYFEKLHTMQWILFIYLGVSLILGGAAALAFARSHYTPIEKLMAGVDRLPQNGRSEYDIITEYYASVKEAYNTSQAELMASRRELHNSRLARLLKCGDNRKAQKYWEELDTDNRLAQGRFLMAGVVIPQMEQGRTGSDGDDYLLNSFIVDNVVTEVLGKRFHVISGEVDGFFIYVIQIAGENSVDAGGDLVTDGACPDMEIDADAVAQVIQALEYAAFYVEQYFHLKFCVNISHVCSNRMHIGSCFEEIKELQEYRDWSREDSLRFYTAGRLYHPGGQEQERVENYHKHTDILKAIKAGDYVKAETLLSAMLKKEQEPALKNISGKRKDIIIGEIVAYIDTHYDDWQLSGKMFAEKYNVSLSYLSQIFKKEKGIGLLDYINQIRYIKAKAMIEAGATIQEAATRAGYATTQPLRRLFRQFEGVTPSQSRKKKADADA